MEEASEFHGGVLPGELKLAMMLRMLAGASYLDLLDTYASTVSTVYESFHEAITWIESSFMFPLVEMLKNKNVTGLEAISRRFAEFSNGIFTGIIGVIDGIAICIRCEDNLPMSLGPTCHLEGLQ